MSRREIGYNYIILESGGARLGAAAPPRSLNWQTLRSQRSLGDAWRRPPAETLYNIQDKAPTRGGSSPSTSGVPCSAAASTEVSQETSLRSLLEVSCETSTRKSISLSRLRFSPETYRQSSHCLTRDSDQLHDRIRRRDRLRHEKKWAIRPCCRCHSP
jgi:hypothetical protein